MEKIMVYLLASIPILILVYLILLEIHTLINRNKLNVPNYYVSYDDVLSDSQEISKFLKERSDICNKYFNQGKTESEKSDNKKQRQMLYDLDHNIILFLRLCHSLGCEVVIRQRDINDLEKRNINLEISTEKILKVRDKHQKHKSIR